MTAAPSYPQEKPDPDQPLRLQVAAEIAFPDGGVSASSLRREAERGNLEIERIAGKDFTTLAAIERMRKKCRVQQKASGSGSGANAKTGKETSDRLHGSSAMERSRSAQAAVAMIAKGLKKRLPNTSPKSTAPTPGNVIRLTSR